MIKSRKSGLGRGLDSLLGGDTYKNSQIREPNKIVNSTNYTNKEEQVKNNNVIEIPTINVVGNPHQPRTKFSEKELNELSDSIKRNGLLQPIIVTPLKEGKYEVIAGERRLRACKLAQIKKIPVIISDVDQDKKIELAMIENIQRENLNPMEEAYGYKKILDNKEVSHAELASMVSKGRSTITNSLRLLELPKKAQDLLYEGKISAGHARAILSIASEDGQNKLIEQIIEERLSVRETEKLANIYSGREPKALKTARPITPKSYKKAALALKDYFGNQVKVKKAQGKNKIEIEFKDEKELEKILNLIIKD